MHLGKLDHIVKPLKRQWATFLGNTQPLPGFIPFEALAPIVVSTKMSREEKAEKIVRISTTTS